MREPAERQRDRSAEEVSAVPDVSQLPDGAQVIDAHSYGTYDGTRFDGIDPSALHDCFFICPRTFGEIAQSLEVHLIGLGWPGGIDVKNATDDPPMPWRQWSREKEGVELFDFTKSDWTHFEKPPTGWSLLRINYWRKPARDFSSDDEREAWFKEGLGKGERWRDR